MTIRKDISAGKTNKTTCCYGDGTTQKGESGRIAAKGDPGYTVARDENLFK